MSNLTKLEKYIIEWSIEHAKLCNNMEQLNHLQELLRKVDSNSKFRIAKRNVFNKYK